MMSKNIGQPEIDSALYIDRRITPAVSRKIQYNDCDIIEINNEDLCLSGYSFVHDLDCSHFNPHLQITNIENSNIELSFDKEYTLINESTTIHHNIELIEDYIVWKLKRTKNSCATRFGISLKIDLLKASHCSERIYTSIINYSQMWRQNWPGQTNIPLPVISVQCFNKNVLLCLPPDQEVQFYLYNDNDNNNYIKIATLDEYSDSLDVYYFRQSGSAYDFYKGFFKCFQREFNFIGKEYNIQVNYNRSVSLYNHYAYVPSEIEIISYKPIFEQELQKYNPNIFKTPVIITLCGNLLYHNSQILGFTYNNSVLLNISSSITDYAKRMTLHHEIFHLLHPSATEEQANAFAKQMLTQLALNPSPTNKLENNIKPRIEMQSNYTIFVLGRTPIIYLRSIIRKSDRFQIQEIEHTIAVKPTDVFLTLHPILFAAEQHDSKAIEFWIKQVSKIIQSKCQFIKFEDLLMGDARSWQYFNVPDSIFRRFTSLDFIKDCLRLSEMYNIADCWMCFAEHPAVKYFGYSGFSYG